MEVEGINSGSVINTISIALLVAGRPSDATCEATGGRGYVGMFEPLFERALSSIPRYHYHQKKKLHFRAFDVTHGELPEEGQLGDGLWDALLVTGSPDSVTANAPWMDALMRFLVHVAEDHPLVRILGICFGHQLVARAFGGRVERNPAGGVVRSGKQRATILTLQLGVEKCQLTERGRELLDYDENSYMMIEQFHWDHVAEAPGAFQGTQFELLASSERTPVEALSLHYPTEAPPLPSIAGTSAYVAFDVDDTCAKAAGPMPVRSVQVLTLQGHPEFDTATVQRELTVLHEAGRMDRKAFDIGMDAAAHPNDGMHLACIILGMLGVEPASGTEDL